MRALKRRPRATPDVRKRKKLREVWSSFKESLAPEHEAPKEQPAPGDNRRVVPEGQRRCPVSRGYMESDARDDVIADICDDHGIWLDEGELDHLVQRMETRIHRDKAGTAQPRKGSLKSKLQDFFSSLTG